MKKMILATLVLLMGSMALADQCAYVSKKQATTAAKVLDNAKRVQSLCEPCGEIKASDVTVSSIEVKATGYQNTYEVLVNGKGIDLAYTFVNGINLGIALSCPAQGVSSSLN